MRVSGRKSNCTVSQSAPIGSVPSTSATTVSAPALQATVSPLPSRISKRLSAWLPLSRSANGLPIRLSMPSRRSIPAPPVSWGMSTFAEVDGHALADAGGRRRVARGVAAVAGADPIGSAQARDQVVAVAAAQIVVAVGPDQDRVGCCLEDRRVLDRGERVTAAGARVLTAGEPQVSANRGVELAPGDAVRAGPAVVDVVLAAGAVLDHPVVARTGVHLVPAGAGVDVVRAAAAGHQIVALVGVDVGAERQRPAELGPAVGQHAVVAGAGQEDGELGVAQVDVGVGGFAGRDLLVGVQVDAGTIGRPAEAPEVVARSAPDVEPVVAGTHQGLDVDLVAVAGLVHLARREGAATQVDREVAVAARVVGVGYHVRVEHGRLPAAAHRRLAVLHDDVVAATDDLRVIEVGAALDRERAAREVAGHGGLGRVRIAGGVERAGNEERGGQAAEAGRASGRGERGTSHTAIVGAAHASRNPP